MQRLYTEKMPYTNSRKHTNGQYGVWSRHTIHYYHSFFNEADNKEIIAAHKQELRQTLLAAVKKDMGTKIYKEAGFNFRYTYHSGKAPKTVLFDQTYKKGEY